MKLVKFYAKYFLFCSTHKVKNIERVIRSHGFEIQEFDPLETSSSVLHLNGCAEFAKFHPSFLYVQGNIKDLFIQEGLSDDDRIEYLFHEEAHIWYNHINTTGFTENSNAQQEKAANLFLLKLRILKFFTSALLLITILLAGLFLLPKTVESGQITPPNVAAAVPQLPEEAPAQPIINTVYITGEGNCYHTATCSTVQNSTTLSPISCETAEALGKTPCRHCINQKEKAPAVDQTAGAGDSCGEGRFPAVFILAQFSLNCKNL